MARYSAAICKRGHIVNRQLEITTTPPGNFCAECGAPVMFKCDCGARLLGGHEGAVLVRPQPPDAFCQVCGSAFPWATREQRIGQLHNLLDFEDLDEADRLHVAEALAVLSMPEDDVAQDDLVRAGETVRRLAPGLWETGRPVLVTLLSAWLKDRLGLNP